jgi:putative hydrolase of the HAD superfamily
MKYTQIFFDLDHTLWDFEKCSAETLQELYYKYDLGEEGNIGPEEFVHIFHQVNAELWDKYNHHLIDKAYIRENRFKDVFRRLGMPAYARHQEVGDEYLANCPRKPYLIPHTLELLDYLAGKYPLHIITNGFHDVQHIKMSSSGILGYFKTVVTSECSGHRKPDPRMFDYALKQAGCLPAQAMMIGDNAETDVQGASDFGIDAVFYNPDALFHKAKPKYEIKSLKALMSIL